MVYEHDTAPPYPGLMLDTTMLSNALMWTLLITEAQKLNWSL